MIMFLIQIIFIIFGIIGFFANILPFMLGSLIGLIICDILGFISGALNSLNMDFLYLFIAIILSLFIDREFWELLSITFAICGAIESILGIILMSSMKILARKKRRNLEEK